MTISVSSGKIEQQSCDLLIAPYFQSGPLTGALRTVDAQMNGFIKQVIEDEQFQGKPGQTVIVHTHDRIPATRVLIIGLGEKKECTSERLRQMAGTAVTVARTVKASTLALSLEGYITKTNAAHVAEAVTEGALLGNYQFLKYKGTEEKKEVESTIQELHVVEKDAKRVRAIKKGVHYGELHAQATIVARDLVNEPAVHMKPKTMATFAEKIGKTSGVKTTIYNQAALKKLKMEAFLGVAQGSDEEPFLIHMVYKPKVKKKVKKVVLCGKGITFDSGGISLKQPDWMMHMKSDMGGAAAILGLFSTIAEIAPAVEVHGVVAVTENMPSGKALKPGDVVTAYNKKTIEVLNTDAEGRLILADALSWAEDTIKPDIMVDIATLTGAVISALGQEIAAMMSADKKLIQMYQKASKESGEKMWEMPLLEEYKELLKSDIADIKNIQHPVWAGTITAGLFLSAFVDKTPWMHLDIAGPAWIEKQMLSYAPKGASGFGVRSLIHFLHHVK